jgi:hypothetical protein
MEDVRNSPLPCSNDTTLRNTPECSTPLGNESTVEKVASKAIDKVDSVLRSFHEAPSYQQDNHFIIGGYRGELNSFKRCFDSLWYLHNETGIRNPVPIANSSEHMVSSPGGSWLRCPCWSDIFQLLATLSNFLEYRYSCLCLLFRRCSNMS